MTRSLRIFLLVSLCAGAAFGHWEPVGPGIDYQEFRLRGIRAYVARIDLADDRIRLVATDERDRGLTTSDWAAGAKAIVAVNADFFDANRQPVGLAIGPCGRWNGTEDTAREGVVAAGAGRVEVHEQAGVLEPVPDWVETAVSGWPLIVESCDALDAGSLPGGDAFTRSPHPRTAVGLTAEGRWLFLVVIDGRREGVPGVTLARLAEFMQSELGVCRALNLDGGGSSTMVVNGEVRNEPSDGRERPVANHLGVVLEADHPGCRSDQAPLRPRPLSERK
ncbi:MAG TPA: phosphodiester glycosidase family protein [Thermoanaerobaculia bacterium]|nr:phosphodiester glycosidase family protein [Thermoanaerobaculia bacterium]